MNNLDARKLNQQTQYELRKQVVRLRKKGLDNQTISEIVGLSKSHVSTIWKKYERGGLDAIKPGLRGRRHGAQRELTAEQEIGIQKLLVDKTPDHLKLSFALWTRDAVRLAIKQLYGRDLPLRTITDYLKRWGFTPQKPTKRAYEQNPKLVAQWHATVYPEIQARAKQEKAEIHWGDETGIQNDAYNAKGSQRENARGSDQCHQKPSQHDLVDHQPWQGAVHAVPGKHDQPGPDQVHVPFGQGH